MTSRNARSFIAHLFARWLWGNSLLYFFLSFFLLQNDPPVTQIFVERHRYLGSVVNLKWFRAVGSVWSSGSPFTSVSDLNGQQGHFKTNRDSGMNYLKRSVITILNLINQIKLKMRRCPVWRNGCQRERNGLWSRFVRHVLSQISTNLGILNQQLNCNILLLCTSTSHRLHLFRFKQLQ